MGDKACKKLVKVDNWGMFFLQRLQQHFSRDEFCDFTLNFTNGEKVKAHRLVLDVCTEYFQILQNQGLFIGNVVNMPEDMLPDVVVPVVNFMYTGRLEFRADIQERLYATAQKMKMTVLTKLLDAQSLNSQQQLKSQQPAKPKPNQVSPKKLPPGSFTNLQGKKVSPRIVDPNLAVTLPGRKLPIWKRRSIPIYSQQANADTQFDQPIRIITTPTATASEPPRPTRFEWPDDTDEPSTSPLAATFEDISYESKPLMQLKQPKPNILVREKPPVMPMPVEKKATFEDVYRTGAVGLAKRPATDSISAESAKKAKTVDLQAMKEYLQEAHVRSRMIEGEDSEEDVDDDLDASEMMNNDEEDEEEEENDDNDEDTSFEQSIVTPHKSILKTTACTDDETHSNKRVRFSVDDGCVAEKENEAKLSEPRMLPTRALSNISATSMPAANHAKIISEVLKKYPHLVKNNKNIRLKIMQRGGSPAAQQTFERDSTSKPVKSKVSYVVLKSDATSGRMKGVATVGSKPSAQSHRTSFPKVVTGAENVDGPWLCHPCGTDGAPVHFETYYAYRRHLQDVHLEKVDVRICEHCGHRASKRNLLLYHLYTKHNIEPPRSCSFPKCDQCEYVALSESLLAKHRINHSVTGRDYVCRVCNANFRSQSALAGHMQANLHQGGQTKKDYECPHCAKPFSRNINLKVHIRQCHRELTKQPEGEDGNFEAAEEDEEEGEDGDVMLEVPVLDGADETASGMTILAEAPASLEPSSEAEGLGHVASGIATSLGLTDGQQTVILLDNNQEYILHTTEVEGNEYGVIDGNLVQEGGGFIVPDLMDGDEAVHGVREEEDDGTEDLQESNVAESEEHMAQNSGEVMMVLSDHCYAEDKDENQLQENHSQDLHLQTNELSGLEYVRPDDVDAESKLVVGGADQIRRIVFTNKSKQIKAFVPQPPLLLPAASNEEQQQAEECPATVSKPAEMSNLLDDWDEECTEDMQDGVENAVANLHNAMPTRDETYIMSNAAVREDSYLPRQELAPTVANEDLPIEPALDSDLPDDKEGITLLASDSIDSGKDNSVETAESASGQQLIGMSDQHLVAPDADLEDTSLPKVQEENGNTPGVNTLPAAESEMTSVPSTINAAASEVLEAKDSESESVQDGLEGTQYTQDNVEFPAAPNDVVENHHNAVLSDENVTGIKEEVDDSGRVGKGELATGEVSENVAMAVPVVEEGSKAE